MYKDIKMKNKLIIMLASIALLSCFRNTMTMNPSIILEKDTTSKKLINEFIEECKTPSFRGHGQSVSCATASYRNIKGVMLQRIKKYPHIFPDIFRRFNNQIIEKISDTRKEKDKVVLSKNDHPVFNDQRPFKEKIKYLSRLLIIFRNIKQEYTINKHQPAATSLQNSVKKESRPLQTSSGRTVKPPLLFKAGPATSKPE